MSFDASNMVSIDLKGNLLFSIAPDFTRQFMNSLDLLHIRRYIRLVSDLNLNSSRYRLPQIINLKIICFIIILQGTYVSMSYPLIEYNYFIL